MGARNGSLEDTRQLLLSSQHTCWVVPNFAPLIAYAYCLSMLESLQH